MKYGYARVSTVDQNPALQLAALKKAGCQKIFKDERTGENTKRPALLRRLKTLQDGDTLIVWKLDRLGRSLRDLVSMLDDFHRCGDSFPVAHRRNQHQHAGRQADFSYLRRPRGI